MSGTRAISTTSRRELSSSFFFLLQGKAPKEIHAILTETLACFLRGGAKNLSAPLYITKSVSPLYCLSPCAPQCLYFLFWPLIPPHCRCRGLLVHLILHTCWVSPWRGIGSSHSIRNKHPMLPATFEPAIPEAKCGGITGYTHLGHQDRCCYGNKLIVLCLIG